MEKKIARYSALIARYSISRGSMLTFTNFARYGAIYEIARYIALKRHSVSALIFCPTYRAKDLSFHHRKKRRLLPVGHGDE